MTTASELRPADPADARVWDAASTVHDPEIPVLSIADLGILREARAEGEKAVVVITPTYSGCPAMDTITNLASSASKLRSASTRINTTPRRRSRSIWRDVRNMSQASTALLVPSCELRVPRKDKLDTRNPVKACPRSLAGWSGS